MKIDTNTFIIDEQDFGLGTVVALSTIQLTDAIKVPSQRTITDAGQMIVPCAFARTGVQLYKGSSLGLIDQADETIEVHRTDEVVFDEASMESFRSSPVTIGHPKDSDDKPVQVTSANSKEYQVGMLEGMPARDEDTLSGTLVISDQTAIDKIEGGTVELSAGYTCDIVMRDDKYYQENIRANHIAIVDKGRAGSCIAIADEDTSDKEDVSTDAETTDMTEAEAAEAVAVHEEQETLMAQDTVEWATQYAEDAKAMATAHAEVAKAARKIANKKAKSTTDEADEGGDTVSTDARLSDDVQLIIATLDSMDEVKTKLEDDLQAVRDSLDKEVALRSDVVITAKSMTDLSDFTGKTVYEIKKMVVNDQLDIDLTDKSKAYIEARFDILCEDSEKETPMGKLLKDNLTSDAVKWEDPVKAARKNMIERNLNKENK